MYCEWVDYRCRYCGLKQSQASQADKNRCKKRRVRTRVKKPRKPLSE